MFFEEKFEAVVMPCHGAVHERGAAILLHRVNSFYKKTSTPVKLFNCMHQTHTLSKLYL
jgi:hypothetical protein